MDIKYECFNCVALQTYTLVKKFKTGKRILSFPSTSAKHTTQANHTTRANHTKQATKNNSMTTSKTKKHSRKHSIKHSRKLGKITHRNKISSI